MNKSEPVGEWLKRQGRVHIRYGDAIDLIRDINTKKDNLGMEMIEWIDWSEEVVGMISDLFNISEKEVK